MTNPIHAAGQVATFKIHWILHLVLGALFVVQWNLLWEVAETGGSPAYWSLISALLCADLAAGAFMKGKQLTVFPLLAKAVFAVLFLIIVLCVLDAAVLLVAFGIPAGPTRSIQALWFFNVLATTSLLFAVLGQSMLILGDSSSESEQSTKQTALSMVGGGNKSAVNPAFDEESGESVTGEGSLLSSPLIGNSVALGALSLWLALLVLVTMMSWHTIAYTVDYYSFYPGEDNFVKVDGHLVQIKCEGELNANYPPVLLEHGLSGSLLDWAWIQPQLAERTRVCAYSKSGYGYSERGVYPRKTPQLAKELREVVAGLGFDKVEGGFMVVGHSFAGHNIRYFNAKYPGLIKGIVFVDAVNAEVTNFFAPQFCASNGTNPDQREDNAEKRQQVATGYGRVLEAFRFTNDFDLIDILPEPIQAEYTAQISRSKYFETTASEGYTFPQSCDAVNTLPVTEKFLNFPVVSLGAEFGIHAWNNFAGISGLAAMSPMGESHILNGTSHTGLLFVEQDANDVAGYALGLLEKLKEE